MGELLERINYSTNLIFENIDHIIKSGKAVGVYGNGIYAGYIERNLKKWSIDVDYYVIDDKYYNESFGSNVIKLSELTKFNDSILIIGFETLIGNEASLRERVSRVLSIAPSVEILEFEHCYIDYDFITYRYILDNHSAFQETYDLLSDDLSKQVMIEYLNTCISGRSELLGLLNQDYKHDYDYDLLYPNSGYKGVVVECGAFDGKTAIELSEYLKEKKSEMTILALEPDPHNYEKLCDRVKLYADIEPVKYGTSYIDGILLFDQQCGSGSTVVERTDENKGNYIEVPVRSIDSIKEEYGHIDSVLMDIEGSELDTLKGSIKTIEQEQPKFGVRVYHKKDDLITIPQFFKSLENKQYKLYLRNSQSTRGHLDVTLYAI